MNDTETLVQPPAEVTAEPTAEERRKGLYYLFGGLALMLIPIIFGIVLANTGGDPNEEASGMPTAPGGVATESDVPGTTARTNLAVGASVVETSSEFNENFAGSNAIDGSLATEWSTRGDGDEAFIVIDLGAPQEITGVGFRTREMSDGTSTTESYTVTIDDGESLGPFDAGVGLVVSDFTATGQVVRIDLVTTTGGNTGAVEIEIYGS